MDYVPDGQPSGDLSPAQQIKTLQIIVVGLAMGLLVFGVVVNTVIGPAKEPENGLLTQIGLGFGLVALVVHRIVGSVIESSAKRQLPADEEAARRQLMGAKTVGTIVTLAIPEGAAFLNLIVYGFMEGQPISMMMAALLWFAILIKFPLPGALESWLDRELRAVREERSLNRGN